VKKVFEFYKKNYVVIVESTKRFKYITLTSILSNQHQVNSDK